MNTEPLQSPKILHDEQDSGVNVDEPTDENFRVGSIEYANETNE